MSEVSSSPFNQHQEALNRVPDVEVLAKSERNIGSLRVDTIEDGAILPMDTRVGLEADFDNIDALNIVTPQAFEEFKGDVNASPDFEKFRQRIEHLSPSERELELKVFFIAGLAARYFGGDAEDSGFPSEEEKDEKKAQRDKTFDEYPIDGNREDTLFVKPLSESGEDAVCTEYSVFAKEALQRLGEDFSYVAAEKRQWPDLPSFYHSFLVSQDGKIIIDPLEAAQTFPKSIPYGISTLTESFYKSTQPVVPTRIWGNSTMTYSLTHIPAPSELEVAA